MDRSVCIFLGCICIVLSLLLGQNGVQGKCSGKWAIHACRGGNGKRADPMRELEPPASTFADDALTQALRPLQINQVESPTEAHGFGKMRSHPWQRFLEPGDDTAKAADVTGLTKTHSWKRLIDYMARHRKSLGGPCRRGTGSDC